LSPVILCHLHLQGLGGACNPAQSITTHNLRFMLAISLNLQLKNVSK
jgi:hypothetical protein